jgi:hypothetical protein
MLEKEAIRSQFFIRPRRFGKSMLLSTLQYYYDLNEVENFDKIFGSLYIGKHPTPEKNDYAILKFDFSGIDTASEKDFRNSFSNKVQNTVRDFFRIYQNTFSEAEYYIDLIAQQKPGAEAISLAISAAKADSVKLFVIIDEYDHFANDLIAQGKLAGKDIYKLVITANGLVRDFYERLKTGAMDSTVYRTFITGISPVMLDDLTSGYNIADMLTLNPDYNEMMGFTQKEVEWLMKETCIDSTMINIDMEAFYNGYLFHADGENRVYNPTMVLYLFQQIRRFKKMPKNIIDNNLKTDYGRLQRLIQNEQNRETLMQIIRNGEIIDEVLEKFSIDRLTDQRYFVSLLFYMGLLTIKEEDYASLRLCIPNYSIKTLYWEYLIEIIQETSPEITIQLQPLKEAIIAMAMEGDVKCFIDYISENAFSKLSDHDLQRFDEKYIQILMLAYLFMSKMYLTMSEYETVPGRADIFLQRHSLVPQVRYEWIIELKYCKVSATESEIAEKRSKGIEQVEKYVNSYRMDGRDGLKAAVIIFIGKDKFEIIEYL